jgi:F420-non-reducing hydrogenase small subunit
MPCRGCFGPTRDVKDHGAKFLSSLASILSATDEDAMQEIVDSIPDPAGLVYMYSLATSFLGGRVKERKKE